MTLFLLVLTLGSFLQPVWLSPERSLTEKPHSSSSTNGPEEKDICAKFLEKEELLEKDLLKKTQNVLGKYICTHISDQEMGQKLQLDKVKPIWTDQVESDHKEIGVFGEEIFDELRGRVGIDFQQLADSFLSDEMVELHGLGKSKVPFYRTNDEKFLVKGIKHEYEIAKIEETLGHYAEHLMELGNDSFLSKFYLVFRFKHENEIRTFILMNNVFWPARDLQYVKFDVKGVFSFQRPPYPKYEDEQNLNEKVLKWYHFFGWQDYDGMQAMFPEGIVLDKQDHQRLTEKLKRDFEILSKNDVSDWSIIFAVNFEDKKEQNDATIDDENATSSYIRAHCNKCRSHPNSSEVRNNQTLRICIGIVDFLLPYREYLKIKTRHMKNQKEIMEADQGANILEFVKGVNLETFGPIPPTMYSERMLAFFMGCAMRWHPNAASVSEDARRTMIGGFCDAYGKPWDGEEMRAKTEAKGYSLLEEFRNVCQDGQERTLYGVQLFKELMEEKHKHWWTLMNVLAEDYAGQIVDPTAVMIEMVMPDEADIDTLVRPM